MKRSKRRKTIRRQTIMDRIDLVSIILIYAFLITGIIKGIKNLLKYNGLFENSILHAPLSYQLYGVVYIIHLILYCIVLLFTIKLSKKFNGAFSFSRDNQMLLLKMAFSILAYSFVTTITSMFINIEARYYQVLSHQDFITNLLLVTGAFLGTMAVVYGKSIDIKEEHDLTI